MSISDRNKKAAQKLFFKLIVATIVVTIAGLVLAANYDVIDKGEGLLPYTNGYIYDVRFFDAFNLYIERENKKPKDIMGGLVLGAMSSIAFCFMFLLILFARSEPKPGHKAVSMFFWLGMGALFLAADELFGIHESVGHNARFLLHLPIVARPDDFVIALYLVPAIAFLVCFRHQVTASRTALLALATSIALFGGAVVSDLIGATKIEEILEVLAALSLLSGVFVLGIAHLEQVLHS